MQTVQISMSQLYLYIPGREQGIIKVNVIWFIVDHNGNNLNK